MRVCLIVDDDVSARKFLRAFVESQFIVLEAGSAAEAMKTMYQIGGKIDLLITDVNMPGDLDGLDLAFGLQADFGPIPTIVISGSSEPEDVGHLSRCMFLAKPISVDALSAAVLKLAGYISTDPAGAVPSDFVLPDVRSKWQAFWQRELQQAKERLSVCSRHLKNVLGEQQQGLLPPPDGSFAVRQAVIWESAARKEYVRIIRIINELQKKNSGTSTHPSLE